MVHCCVAVGVIVVGYICMYRGSYKCMRGRSSGDSFSLGDDAFMLLYINKECGRLLFVLVFERPEREFVFVGLCLEGKM